MYDTPELTPSYTKNDGSESWQQPLWLAFLASLGIHAMLGINLPNIPLFSKPVKLPPTVGLVELTPEQIARLPQPKTEPEISLADIQLPPNITQIPRQQPSFPRVPPTSTAPSVRNLPQTSVGRSSYEIPERPPARPTVPLQLGRNFPSPAPRLPRNRTPVNDDFTYVPPPSTPVLPPLRRYSRPLPNLNRPSLPPLPQLPEENQGPTDAEIRRSLNLNDDVYESGLFARRQNSDSGNSNSNSTEFKGSLLEGLRRPQERVQDKVAAAPTNSSPTVTRTQTPATPATAAEPEPTKVNRLPESPLARQIREGKALQELVRDRQQPEPVAVVTPETRQPTEPRESPAVVPEVEVETETEERQQQQPAPTVERQGEFKGSLLESLERAREERRQIALTPEPETPTPTVAATPSVTTPEPETPTPTVAATPQVEPSPVAETAPEVEPSPEPVEPSPVAETAPEVEPSPEPKEEFKGTLLASLQGDREEKAETVTPEQNSTPPQETAAVPSIEVPTAEFEEQTPATVPATEERGEFKGALLAKLEQYRRQQEQMDAAGEGVFSAAERSAIDSLLAYTEWANALSLEESNLTTPTKIADVYPDAACSVNLTGKALVVVLVNAGGEIVEGPELLLESGHEVLDEAALNAVSDRSFEVSDKSKAYQYAFSFNGSECEDE